MSRKKALSIAAVFTVVGLIVGLVLSSDFGFQSKAFTDSNKETVNMAAPPRMSQAATDTLMKYSDAMVELVEAVKPSVVSVMTSHKVVTGVGMEGNPFLEDPFFRRFFGDDFVHPGGGPHERKESALGSGVIVEKDGYIITNYHVVKDAEEIKVTLGDKREFKGKVIGTDPKTDVAVVKIEARDLPAIRWGDSDKLRVGETVLAVGSPYGLSQTVTSGIVSAKGRANVRIADYEDFIQTDAAINPGNSGGPLVNARGELVGINTAIFSTSGGYQGIGFSIPSNMVRVVMDSLIKEGKVTRGWLGVTIQPLSKDMAAQFGLKDQKGSIVSDVTEGGPAEKAGLKPGDIITAFDGKPVDDPSVLRNIVASTHPGAKLKMEIIRNGKPKTLTVEIEELKEPKAPSRVQQQGKIDNVMKGVTVQNLTPELRDKMGLSERIQGVVITQVTDEVSDYLRPGDVILEVNKTAVTNVKEYMDVVTRIKAGQNILLRLARDGGIVFLIIPG